MGDSSHQTSRAYKRYENLRMALFNHVKKGTPLLHTPHGIVKKINKLKNDYLQKLDGLENDKELAGSKNSIEANSNIDGKAAPLNNKDGKAPLTGAQKLFLETLARLKNSPPATLQSPTKNVSRDDKPPVVGSSTESRAQKLFLETLARLKNSPPATTTRARQVFLETSRPVGSKNSTETGAKAPLNGPRQRERAPPTSDEQWDAFLDKVREAIATNEATEQRERIFDDWKNYPRKPTEEEEKQRDWEAFVQRFRGAVDMDYWNDPRTSDERQRDAKREREQREKEEKQRDWEAFVQRFRGAVDMDYWNDPRTSDERQRDAKRAAEQREREEKHAKREREQREEEEKQREREEKQRVDADSWNDPRTSDERERDAKRAAEQREREEKHAKREREQREEEEKQRERAEKQRDWEAFVQRFRGTRVDADSWNDPRQRDAGPRQRERAPPTSDEQWDAFLDTVREAIVINEAAEQRDWEAKNDYLQKHENLLREIAKVQPESKQPYEHEWEEPPPAAVKKKPPPADTGFSVYPNKKKQFENLVRELRDTAAAPKDKKEPQKNIWETFLDNLEEVYPTLAKELRGRPRRRSRAKHPNLEALEGRRRSGRAR